MRLRLVARYSSLAGWLAAGVLLGACAQKPTRVSENKERPFGTLVAKLSEPIEIKDATVILDARGAFDFGLNHVGHAVSFSWDRLAQSRDDGEVLRDVHRAGERLALVGVRPETPVVIVGDGVKGSGDDGRLAWTLLKFGVRDVQVVSNESLRKYWSPEAPVAPKNAAAWTPTVDETLELDARDFKSLATSLEDLKAKRIWLIDVRPAKEYLARPSVAGTVNVPWSDFYTNEGRPNARVKRQLRGIDVRADDRVIVLSPRGVRAGAAAYALLSLGYVHVQVLRK